MSARVWFADGIKEGQIAFEASDCTHEFAGKTLDLPEIT